MSRTREQAREYMEKWRAENPGKAKAIAKRYRDSHRAQISAKDKEYRRKHPPDKESQRLKRRSNPLRYLLSACKCRAKRKGLPFDLTINDLVVPETCPVLGISLFFSGKKTANTPSIDRIDNSKGYTKDNILIVSLRSASWKQRGRVRTLAVQLRADGHDVYDLTDPACRQTPEIPPERFPEQFDPTLHIYREYLTAVPEWREAVMCNRQALAWCDACILLLPEGYDAHADWALAVGLGKRTAVVGAPRAGERTPSHLWADALLDSDADVAGWLVGR